MKFKAALLKLTEKNVITLLLLITVGIAIQCFVAGKGNQYTHYNNYMIFKSSFEHLIHNKNLYQPYPTDHFDLYKYSPAFALFMGLFYKLPDWLGLIIFNLLNTVILITALRRLELPLEKMKFLLLFILIELAISLSMTQTNALIAGLIILGFTYLEDDKPLIAALLISLTVFIKLFGLVAFVLWFLYPHKGKFILYSILWFIVLTFIPLIVVTPAELFNKYSYWLTLLKNDHDASYGISFMGWMYSWFGLDLPKAATVGVAALLFCIPLIKVKLYKLYTFRLQMLASTLLWVIIFNHRGENPTYIIAMAGVAIWYFSQKPNKANTILLWLALIFTSFTSTDLITPGWIADKYVEPYCIKTIFCCIIWFKLQFDLLMEKSVSALPKISNEN